MAALSLAAGCENPNPSQADASDASDASETDTNTDTSESESESGGDQLPPIPTLLSPSDGASEQPLEIELCWNPVEDPDGEPLRYRVFIDGTSLSEGILGEQQGYAGPCVGPLLFAHEREYTWAVEAFEADDFTRSSGKSEVWSFSTIGDGLSKIVFADDFELDRGWTIDGDAFAGAWIRGQPSAAKHGEFSSQPGTCANQASCYFTGQNQNGLADDEDVAGGATTLTSPKFDLSGAATATVRLEQFFYKSELMPGAALEIELLTPNDAVPGGYDVHPLALLEAGTGERPANAWTPREYAACGLPMLAGSRLRLRASDLSTGILEAAIDSVSVHAYDDPSLCEPGEGGQCDPELGIDACTDELLCCSQGAINAGIYRCEPPVAGLDFANPTASPEAPGNGALGCDAADLIVNTKWIDPIFTEIFVTETTCELLEGCVGGVGLRRVMLFTVATPNVGSRDLALGVPANVPELFAYSECHDHYHFDEFARYQLRDADDVVIATGHKQAFCLLDTTSWAWPLQVPKFDCVNQGISRGFSDFYDAGLPCQWIDVTDTPPGAYTLRVSLNQPRPGHAMPALNERDYSNNVIQVPVVIP